MDRLFPTIKVLLRTGLAGAALCVSASNLEAATGLLDPGLEALGAQGASLVVPLPMQTVAALVAWIDQARIQVATAQVARRDALWVQAGYGGPATSYLDGTAFAAPKPAGVYPSISGPASPDTNRSLEVHQFSFDVGR